MDPEQNTIYIYERFYRSDSTGEDEQSEFHVDADSDPTKNEEVSLGAQYGGFTLLLNFITFVSIFIPIFLVGLMAVCRWVGILVYAIEVQNPDRSMITWSLTWRVHTQTVRKQWVGQRVQDVSLRFRFSLRSLCRGVVWRMCALSATRRMCPQRSSNYQRPCTSFPDLFEEEWSKSTISASFVIASMTSYHLIRRKWCRLMESNVFSCKGAFDANLLCFWQS